MIEKRRAFEALRAQVEANLALVTRSQTATQAGATHPENRAEHAKDTRATETSYLARGLAERVSELERDLAALEGMTPSLDQVFERGALGALVTLEDDQGHEAVYLLAAAGGGIEVEIDGISVRVLTARSPLGQALLGSEQGDQVIVERPRGRIEATLARIT